MATTHLSELIQQVRGHLRLTQEQLAQRLLISQSALARYEKGDRWPTERVLNGLKHLLGGADDEYLVDVWKRAKKMNRRGT